VVETVEKQKGDTLNSTIFHQGRSNKKNVIPVIYKKRYIGQPTFDSHSPLQQRHFERKSDFLSRTEKSIRQSVLESQASVIEKTEKKRIKVESKLVHLMSVIGQNKG